MVNVLRLLLRLRLLELHAVTVETAAQYRASCVNVILIVDDVYCYRDEKECELKEQASLH